MVWLETPSNPLLKVVDIQAVVSMAKAHNPDIVVVVDNTVGLPWGINLLIFSYFFKLEYSIETHYSSTKTSVFPLINSKNIFP
jgi:cystathionine beta-lyase/cystathionine gamma-synthase